ncbi:hypothetical protein QFC21_000778 [Naganishia friedmannii]|uniref:Uncharacterized protein n=1 Tax=Naganishia friedmannii TaxID=89922 RepID=A0ACC2W7E0_9TREE|nr:hypothetical protein QFC21_000778 [Naganishia friedmannii]
MPTTTTGKSRYKPYLNLSDLGSKKSASNRLSQQTANTVVSHGRTLKGSSHSEKAGKRPRITDQEAVTSTASLALQSEPYANFGVNDSGVGIHWNDFPDVGVDERSFGRAGGEYRHGGDQRGPSGGLNRNDLADSREESARENDKEVPQRLRKALAGPSSASTTSGRDIAYQVHLSVAPDDGKREIGDQTSSVFHQYPVTDSADFRHDLFIRDERFDRIDNSSHFGEAIPQAEGDYSEPMTVRTFSPPFSGLSFVARPFATPGPHVDQHLYSTKTDIGNHSDFLPVAPETEHQEFGYGDSQIDFRARIRSWWAPDTPVKPFSKPFIQANTDLSLEDRYAGTRKTDFIVRPRTDLPAIAEEQEEADATFVAYTMRDQYSSNAPVIEENYAGDTTLGTYAVQDGYSASGPSLSTNTASEVRERKSAGPYHGYNEAGTTEIFERYDSDDDRRSLAMIIEPTSEERYSETSLDGFSYHMPEQPVFDSSGPSWTAGYSSQTISVGLEFDRYHTVPSNGEASRGPKSITPSDDGKVANVIAGQEIQGPRSNVALDVDALEAAAADANTRRDEGAMQSFRVSDNTTSAMNAENDELKVMSSTSTGKSVPGVSFDATIMTTGEKVNSYILELMNKHPQSETPLPCDKESQRQSAEKHKSESIASFSDLDDQADTEHFTDGTHHGQSPSTENSLEFDAHPQFEKGGPRAHPNRRELNDEVEKERKKMDFNSACAFADERGHPGFEVWVDEE